MVCGVGLVLSLLTKKGDDGGNSNGARVCFWACSKMGLINFFYGIHVIKLSQYGFTDVLFCFVFFFFFYNLILLFLSYNSIIENLSLK